MILVAFVSGAIHPIFISFSTNSQIVGRVSPSLGDLFIALASGVAGAFAVSRDDVADSLPGMKAQKDYYQAMEKITGIGERDPIADVPPIRN